MSKLANGLPLWLVTVALVAVFGLIVFRTVFYASDCRSPHKTITIGGSFRSAGRGGER